MPSSVQVAQMIIYLLVSIFIVFVIVVGVRDSRKSQQNLSQLQERLEYHRQGKEYPSSSFFKLIPEMISFLEDTRQILIAAKKAERHWNMGISYNEYTNAILKIGSKIDAVLKIPDCFEARKLISISERILLEHQSALSWWEMQIKYKGQDFDTRIKQNVEKALKYTKEFEDYYQYLAEECQKRK